MAGFVRAPLNAFFSRFAMHYACICAVALIACVACRADSSRPQLFSTDWFDNRPASMSAAVERLRHAKPLPNTNLAVAVAGAKNSKLIGVWLTDHRTWTFEHALDARPTIAGGVVVASGGGEVFALDAQTGRRLWARPTGGAPFVGAGDDGVGTAITLARGMGSIVLVVARDGSVKRQMETEQRVGSPAVVSGVIFVPWKDGNVSAIDESTGDEIGRITLKGKSTRAFTLGKDLYFGGERLIRLDDNIDLASNGGESSIALPPGDWFGLPRLIASGFDRLPPVATTRDKIRIFARPSDFAGSLGFDSSRFYQSDFSITAGGPSGSNANEAAGAASRRGELPEKRARGGAAPPWKRDSTTGFREAETRSLERSSSSSVRRVSGFDASSGKLVWGLASDVIGGEAIAGGVLVCDENGTMTVLDARAGQVVLERSFGEPIKSCVVHADTFRAPR